MHVCNTLSRNFTSSLTRTVDLGPEQVSVFCIGSSANYISITVQARQYSAATIVRIVYSNINDATDVAVCAFNSFQKLDHAWQVWLDPQFSDLARDSAPITPLHFLESENDLRLNWV